MRLQGWMAAAAMFGLCGCGQTTQQDRQQNSVLPAQEAPDNSAAPAEAPAVPPEPGTPGGLPDDRTPLAEPQGPIDPKSAEAAGQVVQQYGALIEQKRFADAEALWGDAAAARAVSAKLKADREVHLQVGKPGRPEGAAGSIYVTVPTVLYGKHADGSSFSRSGDITLRRVNDVPGSTEAQRRWHIERVGWADPG